MGIKSRLQKRKEKRSYEELNRLQDLLFESGVLTTEVKKEQAMNISSVAACVNLISDTIASLPVYLYKEENGRVTKVEGDPRVALLNDDTGDTLDSFQWKKALIEDYLLNGAGYSYINRERNAIKSLHYVDYKNVSVQMNTDPIFKDYDISVNGQTYRDFEFLKITKNTHDGVTGKGIIAEHNRILSVAYNTLVFQDFLIKTGGNKRGFLKSKTKLSKLAIDELKASWSNLHNNNTETEKLVFLNDGVEFQESNATAVEMQLNETNQANSLEILKLFLVPPNILNGTANEEQQNNWRKVCIAPKLATLQTAFNKDLLLPSQKGSFYWAFDTDELYTTDIEKRFRAHEIGIKNGFLQIDEVRYKEDYEPLDLPFLKFGLQDVLYNPKTKEIYTPNTDKTAKMGEDNKTLEGGDNDANRDPGKPGTT